MEGSGAAPVRAALSLHNPIFASYTDPARTTVITGAGSFLQAFRTCGMAGAGRRPDRSIEKERTTDGIL